MYIANYLVENYNKDNRVSLSWLTLIITYTSSYTVVLYY